MVSGCVSRPAHLCSLCYDISGKEYPYVTDSAHDHKRCATNPTPSRFYGDGLECRRLDPRYGSLRGHRGTLFDGEKPGQTYNFGGRGREMLNALL